MTYGGMIGYYPGTIWLDFEIDRVKGQGHEKVKNLFAPISIQLACNKCQHVHNSMSNLVICEGMRSTKCPF